YRQGYRSSASRPCQENLGGSSGLRAVNATCSTYGAITSVLHPATLPTSCCVKSARPASASRIKRSCGEQETKCCRAFDRSSCTRTRCSIACMTTKLRSFACFTSGEILAPFFAERRANEFVFSIPLICGAQGRCCFPRHAKTRRLVADRW